MSDIEQSRVILVLYFNTKINSEILRWIITIVNFSTEICNIQLSRVIVVLLFSIEILTWLISMLYFSTEISDIELSHVFIQLFFTTEINTAIFTWIIAVPNISNKFVIYS